MTHFLKTKQKPLLVLHVDIHTFKNKVFSGHINAGEFY